MSALKDLTWDHHKQAERQQFAKILVSGKIHPDFYATYLWNQHKKYDILEALAGALGLLEGLGDIRRKLKIEQDFIELWEHPEPPVILPSTEEYIMHMKQLIGKPRELVAHMYVLYLGDLSGGQIIKNKVPGSGTMYDFDLDVETVKHRIKAMTEDDMADEARYVFASSTKLFQELMELDCERYLEHAD
jgi:heme oxygenase